LAFEWELIEEAPIYICVKGGIVLEQISRFYVYNGGFRANLKPGGQVYRNERSHIDILTEFPKPDDEITT
jgi:hypothetical protein